MKQSNARYIIKKIYSVNFKVKLGQDKLWPPHKVCKLYVQDHRNWLKDTNFTLRIHYDVARTKELQCLLFCSCEIKGNTSSLISIFLLPFVSLLKVQVPNVTVPNHLHTKLEEISLSEYPGTKR